MARRTIQSPGVEIRESDLSLRTAQTGTTTYITGFASEGPTDEVIGLGNISEFEQIYGTPKTPAERYFYHTARAALNSSGSLLVNRLPYGDGTGVGTDSTSVGVLAYPAMVCDPLSGTKGGYALSGALSASSGQTYSLNSTVSAKTYLIGAPKHFNITTDEYLRVKSGELFDWSDEAEHNSFRLASLSALGNAAFIVFNKAQTTINNEFGGYYVGLADNTNINPASSFEAINSVLTVTQSGGRSGTDQHSGASTGNFVEIPTSRFEFSLTATPENGTNPATNSISQVMEDRIVGYDIANREFDDALNIGVFKLRQSTFSKESSNLDYLLEEGYNGSVGYYRTRNSENGGAPINFSLGTVEDESRNIDILVNPYLSDQLAGVQLKDDGTPLKKIRINTTSFITNLTNGNILSTAAGLPNDFYSYIDGGGLNAGGTGTGINTSDALLPIGVYGAPALADKKEGNIPLKLDRAFDRVKNDRKFDIDIMAEAGLGTIHAYQQTGTVAQKASNFDDTQTTTAIEALRTSNDPTVTTARTAYTTIFNRFATFAGPVKDGGRGDIIFIADPIRQLLVKGKNSKVQKDPNRNFYTDIYWGLRHQFSLANTSYATVYANWMSVYDNYTGLQTYVPSSGFVAAKMASTDASVGPWGAPAGFNRGIITDASDIAITPNQRQRDDLYTVNLNPIANFADQGNVIFGQKTLLKKPSAFDRVNVRRTFLYLEKITKKTMQFFLFENNTLFTRTRVINTLTPFFERIKADDGLYDFMLVCDDRNNTPEVIDQNELVVDIYLKPVRTAEFILVNFSALRTGTNFEEIVSN